MATSGVNDYSVGWECEPFVDDGTLEMTRELKSLFDDLETLYWRREDLYLEVLNENPCKLGNLKEATFKWLGGFAVFLVNLSDFGEDPPEFINEDLLRLMMNTCERYRAYLRLR